ncbi:MULTISPECIES: hypothetical protein [unclassified Pseudomonas]|jgi:hypothetical protein|uniref:hypothetical protein n=1 Tax=unclassified Pseudomonas TaxID=196821 RepID=UPI001032FF60|nr:MULTISPECIES: hypothetical protein [unclassified Pseudomonas]
MLFDPAVDTVKTGPWVVFLMVVFFGMFGPPGVPYYWSIYCVVVVFFLLITLFLVGACERYVFFVVMIFFTGVGIMGFLFSSVLYLVVSDFFGEGSFKSIAIGLSPLILISLAVAIAAYGRSHLSSFRLEGNKVAFKVESREKYSAGFLAGLLTLTGGGVLKLIGSLNGGALGVLVGTSGCIALILYCRHTIQGLRALRLREHTMPTPYTFMRIDEIREARSRWWLGRLFKWLLSSRQSHD